MLCSPPRFKTRLLLCSYYYALFIFRPKPTLRNQVWFHFYPLSFNLFFLSLFFPRSFSFLVFTFFSLFVLTLFFGGVLLLPFLFIYFYVLRTKSYFFGKPKSTQGVNNVVQGLYSCDTTVTSIVGYSQLSNF